MLRAGLGPGRCSERHKRKATRVGKHAQKAARNDAGYCYDDMYREGESRQYSAVQCSRREGEARGARRRTRRAGAGGPTVPPACASSSPFELPAIAKATRQPPPSAWKVRGSLPCKLQAQGPKAPPQPGSPLDTNGPNRLEADGVHGDGDGDDGDAHASATFHKPRRCTGRLCTGSAVLAATTHTCQHLAAL